MSHLVREGDGPDRKPVGLHHLVQLLEAHPGLHQGAGLNEERTKAPTAVSCTKNEWEKKRVSKYRAGGARVTGRARRDHCNEYQVPTKG